MMEKIWQRLAGQRPTDHDRAQELFSDYIDGRLSPQATSWLEEHLRICDASCPYDLEALRQTVQMVRGLPAVPPPRSFTLSQATLAPRRLPSPGWMQLYLPRATAIAALFLVVLISGDLGLQFLYTASAPAAAPQVALEQAALEETPLPTDREAPPDGEAIGGELMATPTLEAESRAVEIPPPPHPFSSVLQPLEALALTLFLLLGLATALTTWRNQV